VFVSYSLTPLAVESTSTNPTATLNGTYLHPLVVTRATTWRNTTPSASSNLSNAENTASTTEPNLVTEESSRNDITYMKHNLIENPHPPEATSAAPESPLLTSMLYRSWSDAFYKKVMQNAKDNALFNYVTLYSAACKNAVTRNGTTNRRHSSISSGDNPIPPSPASMIRTIQTP
jgi:hypothetical protein